MVPLKLSSFVFFFIFPFCSHHVWGCHWDGVYWSYFGGTWFFVFAILSALTLVNLFTQWFYRWTTHVGGMQSQMWDLVKICYLLMRWLKNLLIHFKIYIFKMETGNVQSFHLIFPVANQSPLYCALQVHRWLKLFGMERRRNCFFFCLIHHYHNNNIYYLVLCKLIYIKWSNDQMHITNY